MPAGPSADLIGELTELALRVATGAAGLLSQYSVTGLHEIATKSSPTDMVSEADRASEAYIVREVRRERPDDAVQGEEGASLPGTSGITWVVDPLDGTTNFLYAIPAYAVSVAARYQGEAVAGAVVNPATKEKWWASRGNGSYFDGVPCQVAEGRSELSTALVATGFAYRPEHRAEQAKVLPRLLTSVRDIRRVGAAALDLCWVASGRYDGYYESWVHEWDWAAGRLICEEAGGKVAMLPGPVPSDGTLVAATPSLLQPLSQLLMNLNQATA